jgi:hypothetical protein
MMAQFSYNDDQTDKYERKGQPVCPQCYRVQPKIESDKPEILDLRCIDCRAKWRIYTTGKPRRVTGYARVG